MKGRFSIALAAVALAGCLALDNFSDVTPPGKSSSGGGAAAGGGGGGGSAAGGGGSGAGCTAPELTAAVCAAADPSDCEGNTCGESLRAWYVDRTPTEMINQYVSGLSVDAKGNVVVVGGGDAPTDIDGDNVPDLADDEGFVAKLRDDLTLEWWQPAGYGVGTIDPGGRYLVTGSLWDDKDANIGGMSVPATTNIACFIARFDEDNGALDWATVFEATGVVYVAAVAEADGDVFVAGLLDSGNLTVTPVGGEQTGVGSAVTDTWSDLFVVRLTAKGEFAEGKVFELPDTQAPTSIAVHPDAVLVAGTYAVEPAFGLPDPVGTGNCPFVLALDKDTLEISTTVEASTFPCGNEQGSAQVVVAGSEAYFAVSLPGIAPSLRVQRLSDGAWKPWFSADIPGMTLRHLAAGSDGSVVIAALSTGPITIDDHVIDGPKGDATAWVAKLDRDGGFLWGRRIDEAAALHVSGLSVTPSERVIVGGGVEGGGLAGFKPSTTIGPLTGQNGFVAELAR